MDNRSNVRNALVNRESEQISERNRQPVPLQAGHTPVQIRLRRPTGFIPPSDSLTIGFYLNFTCAYFALIFFLDHLHHPTKRSLFHVLLSS